MPQRKRSRPIKTDDPDPRQPYLIPNDSPWGGFINIRLDDDQKEAFYAWEGDNGQFVPAYVDEMLGAGCKLSLSYDADHECYVVSVTGALVAASPKSRFCSNSRAGTLPQALALTVWKHLVLALGDYGNYKPRDGSFSSFG